MPFHAVRGQSGIRHALAFYVIVIVVKCNSILEEVVGIF